MLYNVIVRAIELGQTDGMDEKIDIFFALGKLTTEEYDALCAMLGAA